MVAGATEMAHECHWLTVGSDVSEWPLEGEESDSKLNLFRGAFSIDRGVRLVSTCVHSFCGLEQHSQRPVYICVKLRSEKPLAGGRNINGLSHHVVKYS
jgi:hypothetical protein